MFCFENLKFIIVLNFLLAFWALFLLITRNNLMSHCEFWSSLTCGLIMHFLFGFFCHIFNYLSLFHWSSLTCGLIMYFLFRFFCHIFNYLSLFHWDLFHLLWILYHRGRFFLVILLFSFIFILVWDYLLISIIFIILNFRMFIFISLIVGFLLSPIGCNNSFRWGKTFSIIFCCYNFRSRILNWLFERRRSHYFLLSSWRISSLSRLNLLLNFLT